MHGKLGVTTVAKAHARIVHPNTVSSGYFGSLAYISAVKQRHAIEYVYSSEVCVYRYAYQ